MINYHGKSFRPAKVSANGEVSADTTFHYRQEGQILYATYAGGAIIKGYLLGLVAADGQIDFTYQQINSNHELQTGRCRSVPEILPNGKIRLHENWQWTSGDLSSGESVVEEV